MLTPVEHLPLTVVLLALLTLQLLWKTLKALSPWQSLSLHWLCWHEIYRCSYPSNFCREPDEGHKLWWEGQPLMTIDSHHEAASERIDSCFKLSRHGGVAVTKSTSLSLLPAPINHIYSFSKEILPFPTSQKHRKAAKCPRTSRQILSVLLVVSWPI